MPKIKQTPLLARESNVSDVLKVGLMRKRWTVGHLAELLDMDAGNLSRIINHPLTVSLGTIMTIAHKLGIKEIPVK